MVANRLAAGQPRRIPGLVRAFRTGVKRGAEAAVS